MWAKILNFEKSIDFFIHKINFKIVIEEYFLFYSVLLTIIYCFTIYITNDLDFFNINYQLINFFYPY